METSAGFKLNRWHLYEHNCTQAKAQIIKQCIYISILV
jgi:hypothetical protein